MKGPETINPAAGGDAKPTVFIVDDEPMLLDLATVILEPAGYHVRTFRDPDLALEAYKSATPPPALVITDFAMHTMSGLDLIRECRRLHPPQKILLVSGTVDQGIYRDAEAKPDKFLAKPYHSNELVAVVEAMIRS